MDNESLNDAVKGIEQNVKILENSKFEKNKELVSNGRQVKLTLSNENLKSLFGVEKIESVEKFVKTDKFSKKVKIYEFKGGFVLMR